MIPLMILFEPNTYIWLAVSLMVVLTVVAVWCCCRWPRRWLRLVALLLVLAGWGTLCYGVFFGVRGLTVRHVEFASADLPAAFDGYRIVQFSDAHVASLTGFREPLLQQTVDSIMAQHADLIVFTGDLQNICAEEIEPHHDQLSRLKAPDGVFSVFGNHDYPMYVDVDPYEMARMIDRTLMAEERLGWQVLLNQHQVIRRGADSIVVAGMENDGEGRFPSKGDVNVALTGVSHQAFIIMLEHDPSAWRRRILSESHTQLTLSGHTHGGQLSLFGWSPAALKYRYYAGMHYVGQHALNVSTGLSGVCPMRWGVKPEIVVITLRKK